MLTGMSRDRTQPLPLPAYVVLGMIRLGRDSGYEIKQTVELSIRFFWTISHAQIYPALEQLEHAGLIKGRDDPRGRRPRRAYKITRAGEAALKEWLTRDEPLPFELRDIGLVKLFFADVLDRDAALELVEAVRRRSTTRVSQLEAIRPTAASAADHEGYSYPLVTLRLGVAYHQALADECEAIARDVVRASSRSRRSKAS
jgi:DNA-binding PadR family transcriptional regulator